MTNRTLADRIETSAIQFASYVPFDGRIPSPRGPALPDTMAALDVPGASISAIVDGRGAWASGWGVTRSDSGQAVDENTMFQAGSISKMITAVVTLRLVEAGVFALDAVAKVAGTDLLVADDNSWKPRVSIRQLLSHGRGQHRSLRRLPEH